MWEIAENLHRAELTALERSEHVTEWIQLAEKKSVDATDVSSQVATKLSKRGRDEGRPESGVRAAARELNIDKDDAHRAVKVASLSDEAKEAAKETGLDNNRSALLDAATKSEEEQAERIREIAREKEMRWKKSGVGMAGLMVILWAIFLSASIVAGVLGGQSALGDVSGYVADIFGLAAVLLWLDKSTGAGG